MKHTCNILILGFLTLNLFGCAQTLPLISHAHVGHALTSWHDTPDQVGLYVSAQKESKEALSIASGLRDSNEPAQLADGIEKIAYILNPDVTTLNDADFGERYGVIRALEGALEHIEFAATSEDASLNLASSVNELSSNGETVINNFKHIFQLAQQNSGQGNPSELMAQLHQQLDAAVNGRIENNSVVVYGMVNFTDDFNAMLSREQNPRYEPLPRKYVLGLVRLPNGHWGYQLKNDSSSGVVVEY